MLNLDFCLSNNKSSVYLAQVLLFRTLSLALPFLGPTFNQQRPSVVPLVGERVRKRERDWKKGKRGGGGGESDNQKAQKD